MDGATATLKEKLNQLFKEAAQVSVDLDRGRNQGRSWGRNQGHS